MNFPREPLDVTQRKINGSLTEVNHLQQEKESIIAENELLNERNDSLAAEVLDLKQGLDAIEERARSEMGMIKKDETFYQLVDMQNLGRSHSRQKE